MIWTILGLIIWAVGYNVGDKVGKLEGIAVGVYVVGTSDGIIVGDGVG